MNVSDKPKPKPQQMPLKQLNVRILGVAPRLALALELFNAPKFTERL